MIGENHRLFPRGLKSLTRAKAAVIVVLLDSDSRLRPELEYERCILRVPQERCDSGGRIVVHSVALSVGSGQVSARWGLIISMEDGERLSLEQIRAFLDASQEVRFQGKRRQAR